MSSGLGFYRPALGLPYWDEQNRWWRGTAHPELLGYVVKVPAGQPGYFVWVAYTGERLALDTHLTLARARVQVERFCDPEKRSSLLVP